MQIVVILSSYVTWMNRTNSIAVYFLPVKAYNMSIQAYWNKLFLRKEKGEII